MIDPRAEIHASAHIAEDVSIGPWTFIGPDVTIGKGTTIGPHVVIKGPTTIGQHNQIFQFSSIGEICQDKKYAGEASRLEIGHRNTIREYVTINQGTAQGGGVTKIGNDNWIMAYVHLAHDCIVGDHIVFANHAALAGHVEIKDHVTVGAYSAIHQFCCVHPYSFIAKACYVTKDILPYLMIADTDPKTYGLNTVGLKRNGFSSETIQQLKRAYKIIFQKNLTTRDAAHELEAMLPVCPEVQLFLDALQSADRGIVR